MVKIVAIGDNVVDCYAAHGEMYPGGNCLNVSVYARRFGAASAYVGAIGPDAAGRAITHALALEGVDISHLHVLDGATAYCVIGHRGAERLFLTWDLGVSLFTPSADDIAFLAGASAAHVGQSSKLDDHVDAIAAAAPLSYDFSIRRESEHRRRIGPLCFLASVSGGDLSEREVAAIEDELLDMGAQWVLVTRGRLGARLSSRDGSYAVAATSVEAIDTLGAGDTFIARTLVGLLSRSTPTRCLPRRPMRRHGHAATLAPWAIRRRPTLASTFRAFSPPYRPTARAETEALGGPATDPLVARVVDSATARGSCVAPRIRSSTSCAACCPIAVSGCTTAVIPGRMKCIQSRSSKPISDMSCGISIPLSAIASTALADINPSAVNRAVGRAGSQRSASICDFALAAEYVPIRDQSRIDRQTRLAMGIEIAEETLPAREQPLGRHAARCCRGHERRDVAGSPPFQLGQNGDAPMPCRDQRCDRLARGAAIVDRDDVSRQVPYGAVELHHWAPFRQHAPQMIGTFRITGRHDQAVHLLFTQELDRLDFTLQALVAVSEENAETLCPRHVGNSPQHACVERALDVTGDDADRLCLPVMSPRARRFGR